MPKLALRHFLSPLIFNAVLWFYIWAVSASGDSMQAFARYSAHVSFGYLLLAYAIGPLNQVLPVSFMQQLRSMRRVIGLNFAIAHSIHLLALVIYLAEKSEMPTTAALVGGGVGYALMYLMALTSTDAMVQKLGFRKWKVLHTVGMQYLVVIFAVTFLGGIIEGRWFSLNALNLILINAVWLLRLWLRFTQK